MDELKPQSKGNPDADLRYDPASETMRHDSIFSEVAPGIVTSGNLAHKWSCGTDHSDSSAPPTGLKGD